MARGGWRANAGRPIKPLADLRLSGGYRSDRHTTRAADVVMPARPVNADPPEAVTRGLGPSGLTFVRAMYGEYAPSDAEGLLLRLAGLAMDDEARARAEADLKSARAATRQVLGILLRLGFPQPPSKPKVTRVAS